MEDKEFKEKLTPEQYRVMRQKGEEKPFTGKYWDSEEEGIYACAACGSKLFSSEDKFDSETGFPSFKQSLDSKKIELIKDPDSSQRLEVRCKECGSHLGYAIGGEEKYYQLNSASLELEVSEEDEEEEEGDEEEKEEKDIHQDRKKVSKIKTILKNLGVVTAIATISAVVGARAGLIICQNSKISPSPIMPSSASVKSTAGSIKKTTLTPAPVSDKSSGIPPRETSSITPPIEAGASASPIEPPLPPSSDGVTP